MKKQKSCGVVLFREENGERKYLVLKYEGGHWGLVKGTVESGEEETETALREAKEETGISDIQLIPDFRESISYYYMWEGQRIYKTVVYFLGKSSTVDIVLSHEHTGAKWLSFQETEKRLSFENDRKVVTKAESVLTQKHLASFR
jgi:bis(5'-nucleosidyl)-tetraphosphatase